MPINLDDLRQRALALGMDAAWWEQMLTLLGPVLMNLLLSLLERRRQPVESVGHDHGCEAVRQAALGIVLCQDGDHANAAQHYLAAATHCVLHCEGGA